MMKWRNEDAYNASIRRAVAKYGDRVSFDVVRAIIATESGFNPNAYRAEPHISDGSHGLMQVLYRTALGTGWKGNADDLFDPDTNIDVGVHYLSDLVRAKNGDVWAAVSAYNNGNGKRASVATTVCLARNASGSCVQSFTANPGEFFNQPYVDKVRSNLMYFTGLNPSGGTVGIGFLILLALGVALAYRSNK